MSATKAPVQTHKAALEEFVASIEPSRRDFGGRVYRALRSRKTDRATSRALTLQAVAAADQGADLGDIAVALHVDVRALIVFEVPEETIAPGAVKR